MKEQVCSLMKINRLHSNLLCLQFRRKSHTKIKIIFTIIFLISPLADTYSKNFYLSSSIGNDSYTATQAQNPSTPWKTIEKINNSMNLIDPGDSILFKRGDVFFGNILFTRSGSIGMKIAFSAYGTGPLPVISGARPVTNWIRYSGNIWQSDLPELTNKITNLLINGETMQMGRYPNSDAQNKGYLIIDSHSGRTSITSSSLSGFNWTGAEAVIRTKRWILDRVGIQLHQNNTLTFNLSTSYEISDGFGYFIQNHLGTLDKEGEWFYNPAQKRLFLYSISDPNLKKVEASSIATTFEANSIQYFSVSNLELRGASNSAINILSSGQFDLINNSVTRSGNLGINIRNCTNGIINFNEIRSPNNNGIAISGSNSMQINNNILKSIGIRPGMGGSSNGQYLGMFLNGTYITCENNKLDSIGYVGIFFEGNNITIKNNVISNFCSVMDDGGAIYTWSNTDLTFSNRIIEKNILINGIGAGEGTDDPKYKAAEGIYLDGHSNHVTISENTIANCANNGIYIHNSNYIYVFKNTVYNNGCQILINHDIYEPNFPIRNCSVTNNIFFARTTSQLAASFQTIKDDINQFGTFDNNYYCRPLKENQSIYVLHSSSSGTVSKLMDLKDLQTTFNIDINSKTSPIVIPTFTVSGLYGANMITNGTFDYGIAGWSCSSNYNNCSTTWDTGNKISGGSLKTGFNPDLNRNDGYLTLYSNIGQITKDKSYVLRFSLISSVTNKKVQVELREGNSPFSILDEAQIISSSTNLSDYELLITPNQSSSNARIHFLIFEDAENFWFDNIELYEANVIPINSDDCIKFIYNPSNVLTNYSDGNYYYDIPGNRLLTAVLQPFCSNVLLKDPDPSSKPEYPECVNSVIENSTPSKIDLTFNLTLSNIVPPTSAFSVKVNSNTRSVSSVSVSGTKVSLTLSGAIVYGDVVTIAYTKPSTNPLQTVEGVQASSFSAQSVTNRIAAPAPIPAAPVYLSSSVENATPLKLDIIFNLSLANIVPSTSAFAVRVNSNSRSVSSVAVSGTKVSLTLSAAVAYGDVVTVAYTKPSVNPLQTSEGGQAASFSAQTVTNKLAAPAPTPAVPVYVSSSVENATPSKLDIVFNLSLANIVPAASAFVVAVNSGTRSVSSVAISGTKVILTLSGTIAYGDVITVAYNKPSANPLQTPEGGQAASFTAKTVTNKISAPPPAPAIPVYVSSSVENASPTKIDINFNLTLAAIVPPASAFTVIINSASRTVSSIAVSGTKVTLTLSSAIASGNVISVAYTKPPSNQLQTAAGGQVASFTAQPVSNKVAAVNNNPVLVVNSPKSIYSGFVNELNATGSYDKDKDNLSFTWTVPTNVPVSSATGPIIKFLGPSVSAPTTVDFLLKISDGKTTVSKTVPIEILPYKPELEAAEIVNIEASSYYSQNYPYNIVDGNIGTMWSANGSDQWIVIELKESFNVQHVKLAFQSGQKSESFFDILGSTDKVTWEPILIKSASCGFSGDLQVFDFPPAKAEKEYNYVKMIGLGNSADAWNYISELKIYGYSHHNPSSYENLPVKLYPNPAHELINIRIDEPNLTFDFIKIFNLNGKIVYQDILDKSLREFVVPLSIQEGMYLIQMGSDNLTLFTAKFIVSSR